jgi:hypothetical protein
MNQQQKMIFLTVKKSLSARGRPPRQSRSNKKGNTPYRILNVHLKNTTVMTSKPQFLSGTREHKVRARPRMTQWIAPRKCYPDTTGVFHYPSGHNNILNNRPYPAASDFFQRFHITFRVSVVYYLVVKTVTLLMYPKIRLFA